MSIYTVFGLAVYKLLGHLAWDTLIPTASLTTKMQHRGHSLDRNISFRFFGFALSRAPFFEGRDFPDTLNASDSTEMCSWVVVWMISFFSMSPRSSKIMCNPRFCSQVEADREQCERDPRSCGKCIATPWQTLVQKNNQMHTTCNFYAGFQFGRSSKNKKHVQMWLQDFGEASDILRGSCYVMFANGVVVPLNTLLVS